MNDQTKWSRRQTLALAGNTALAVGATGLIAAGERSGPLLDLVDGSTQLLVHDGVPHWWASPDIWVVPGTDPTGAMGSPRAGETAYVWARVANVSDKPVQNVAVRFYWADPSFEMHYSTIHAIGTAFTTIPARSFQDVLCLTPWNVELVNGGHECLVVAASLPGDPALPDLVDVPAYQQVAQKNLTLAGIETMAGFAMRIQVEAPAQRERKVRIGAAIGGKVAAESLQQVGMGKATAIEETVVEVGFSTKEGAFGQSYLDLTVPAGKRVPIYMTVRPKVSLPADRYQLVTAVEVEGQNTLGGVSLIVTGKK